MLSLFSYPCWPFIISKNIYVFLFLALLGLGCSVWAFSGCGGQASCDGFSCWGAQALGRFASAVVACGLSGCGSPALSSGSVVVVLRLSCPVAYAVFLDQGLNQCPAHCKVDS